jgi:hypothetical protein
VKSSSGSKRTTPSRQADGRVGTPPAGKATALSEPQQFHLPSPAARYIRFLILHGRHDGGVRAELDALGLDHGDAGFVGRVRRELEPPKGFRVGDESHRESNIFILKLGLDEIVSGTKAAELAVRILEHRRARELAETLLISGAPHEAIAGAVAPMIAKVSPQAIQQFARLYFDLSRLTRGDVRVILDLRAERDVACAMLESAAAAAAVKRRHRFDPRRIAVDLPQGAPYAHVALLAGGVDVPASEPGVLLRRIRDRAVLRAAERVHGTAQRDADTTLTLVELALRATELMERVQDPQVNFMSELQRVTLRSSEGKLPTIHDLAGKNGFTVDLGPSEDTVQ